MTNYAHPEVLVSTDWVKETLGKPGIKLVEVDVDTKAYDAGHIPGAAGFNWQTQLQDQIRRDIISQETFERLVGAAGISPQDTVVLYGDNAPDGAPLPAITGLEVLMQQVGLTMEKSLLQERVGEMQKTASLRPGAEH